MKNYKELFVWQKAHAFVLSAYTVTKTFPREEQYNLTSQIRRAATSIPTNLAEGCGRFTQLDFARYLQIALGSAQEVEYLTFLSFELGYISLHEFKTLDSQINEVKAMLISLLLKVRKDDAIKKKKKLN
jgi:four helix bundle protein